MQHWIPFVYRHISVACGLIEGGNTSAQYKNVDCAPLVESSIAKPFLVRAQSIFYVFHHHVSSSSRYHLRCTVVVHVRPW